MPRTIPLPVEIIAASPALLRHVRRIGLWQIDAPSAAEILEPVALVTPAWAGHDDERRLRLLFAAHGVRADELAQQAGLYPLIGDLEAASVEPRRVPRAA